MNQEFLNRITYHPNIMAGKPVIRGTRIPVDLLVRMVAQGISQQEILADYPRLHIEDIQAALLYAAAAVTNESVFPLSLEPA